MLIPKIRCSPFNYEHLKPDPPALMSAHLPAGHMRLAWVLGAIPDPCSFLPLCTGHWNTFQNGCFCLGLWTGEEPLGNKWALPCSGVGQELLSLWLGSHHHQLGCISAPASLQDKFLLQLWLGEVLLQHYPHSMSSSLGPA